MINDPCFTNEITIKFMKTHFFLEDWLGTSYIDSFCLINEYLLFSSQLYWFHDGSEQPER